MAIIQSYLSKNLKDLQAITIDHRDTLSFSRLVEDYLSGQPDLKPFFKFTPDEQGLRQALESRKKFSTDRQTLVEVLRDQYRGYELSPVLKANMESLESENTFTVCTAHQPNLLTGPLYFFYKIIHAARLAQYLKATFPQHNFVPLFYMGSEDNDLDELGHFYFRERKFTWDTPQTGAVGRMHTRDLKPLLEALQKALGPPNEHTEHLQQVISDAYEHKTTIAGATRSIIHAFLNEYGLMVLDADDPRLKRNFLPVIREELLAPRAMDLVAPASQQLNRLYKAQAYARPINLFYLKGDIRARIERTGDNWQVLHTGISFTETELEAELEAHPERFSPNVILRGLYQESILPNIAFIGGGSEVAYWMQLMPLFAHYQVFFPPLVLRQSVLWMDGDDTGRQRKLGFSDTDLFRPAQELASERVRENRGKSLDLAAGSEVLVRVLEEMEAKAKAIDPTLEASAKAALAKIKNQVERLEKKMFRAEKRHHADQIRKIENFKSKLFPAGRLQERHDSFLAYYIQYGPEFFRLLFDHTLPFGDRFLILKESR